MTSVAILDSSLAFLFNDENGILASSVEIGPVALGSSYFSRFRIRRTPPGRGLVVSLTKDTVGILTARRHVVVDGTASPASSFTTLTGGCCVAK